MARYSSSGEETKGKAVGGLDPIFKKLFLLIFDIKLNLNLKMLDIKR
jgi:hypothetical protein